MKRKKIKKPYPLNKKKINKKIKNKNLIFKRERE